MPPMRPWRKGSCPAAAWRCCALSRSSLKTDNDDQHVGINIVRKALQTPARQIFTNAGEDGSVIIGKIESCRFSTRESSLSSVLSPASRSTRCSSDRRCGGRQWYHLGAMLHGWRGQARGTPSAGPRTLLATQHACSYCLSALAFARRQGARLRRRSAPRLSTEIVRLTAA